MARTFSDRHSSLRDNSFEPGEYSRGDRLPSSEAEPGTTFEKPISDSGSADDHGPGEQDMVEDLLDQIREALGEATGNPQARSPEAQDEDNKYTRRIDGEHTTAGTHIRSSNRAFSRKVTDSPWPWLLAAAAAGYSLAWLIYGANGRRSPHVTESATEKQSRDHRSGD